MSPSGPEDLLDGGAQALAAVDHEQNPSGEIEPPIDEAREQVSAHRLVLRRALGQAEQMLRSGGIKPDGADHGVLSLLDAIGEDDADGELGEVFRHEVPEGARGAGDEPAGHCGPGGRRGPEVGSNRLQRLLVAARRDSGEHRGHGLVAEQLLAGERRPGGKRDLATGHTPNPGPGDLDPASPEDHARGLLPVAVGGATPGVVLALVASDPDHVLFEERPEHLHADPDREGEQALLHLARKRGELDAHPVGNLDPALPRFPAEGNPSNLGHGGLLSDSPVSTTSW